MMMAAPQDPGLKLSTKELEVLWLYDCKFSDQRISNLLFMKEQEFSNIKRKLFQSFQVTDTSSLLSSATELGFVSKL